jgi:hypothetical protein
MNMKMLIQDDEFRMYPEEGPMPKALEAPFSLVLPMVESVSCLKQWITVGAERGLQCRLRLQEEERADDVVEKKNEQSRSRFPKT